MILERGTKMKRLLCFLVVVLCLWSVLPLLAVNVSDDNTYVIIETVNYTVHWKKGSRMGYMEAFLPGGQNSLIGVGSRAFYHSSSYAGGWKDWEAMTDWEILEEGGGKAVVQYITSDSGSKEYTCVASYYDSVPYIKHELTVKNTGNTDVISFESNHDPMFEPNMDMDEMMTWAQPFPHACWEVNDGFVALYGPEAEAAPLSDRDGRNPGRMSLNHNSSGKGLSKGESATITYYVAFGAGDENDADDLANDVQDEPPIGGAVSPVGSLTTTWGKIRVGY